MNKLSESQKRIKVLMKQNVVYQEIADIEYVALETNDDVLLASSCTLFHVTDEHILISGMIIR